MYSTPLKQRECPPLWARWQHARLSRSGPGFDSRSGQVSWVRFFRGLSSPVKQMSWCFRPPSSLNIIWPSLSSSLILHYRCPWPVLLTRPKTLNYMHSRENTQFQFNWSISFRDIKLIFMCKFQNVPCALGFEVRHSKFFCRSFTICTV